MSKYMQVKHICTMQPYGTVHFFFVTGVCACAMQPKAIIHLPVWQLCVHAAKHACFMRRTGTLCACRQTRILNASACYFTLLLSGRQQYKIVQQDTHARCSHIICTTYTCMSVYSTVYQTLACSLLSLYNLCTYATVITFNTLHPHWLVPGTSNMFRRVQNSMTVSFN